MDKIFVSILCAAVAVALVSYLKVKDVILAKIEELKTKTDDTMYNKVISSIKNICSTISTSFDPVAAKLKDASDDGKLSEEEITMLQEETRAAAFNIIAEIFPKSTLENLGLNCPTVKSLISAEIEASVQRRKSGEMY